MFFNCTRCDRLVHVSGPDAKLSLCYDCWRLERLQQEAESKLATRSLAWIKVADRLPPSNTLVAIVWPDGEVDVSSCDSFGVWRHRAVGVCPEYWSDCLPPRPVVSQAKAIE